MPRQPRFYYPGAVLHIVQRGNNRARVFASAQDHRFYLDCLRDAAHSHDVAIHGYVLMTNHVHLLASPGHADALPRMMQTVGRRYVGRFNFLHQRTGTLWEGRYKATLVETEAYLFTCLRYIELNPVRAGMVAAPGEYRWSSHRGNAFGDNDPVLTPHPSFLALAPAPEERRDAYRALFGEPLAEDVVRAIRDATQFEWALGSAPFREHVEDLTGRRASRLPMGRRPTGGEPKSRL
jgi:putative transposase